MQFKKIEDNYFIKLKRGENIVEILTKFCQQEQIKFGTISAIGGIDQATLGWYELAIKSYHWKDFSGNFEVVSLTGNVVLLNGQPFLHLHTVFSDESHQAFAGHLKEARVAVTLEVVIKKIAAEVERKMDDEIGLNLLDLGVE